MREISSINEIFNTTKKEFVINDFCGLDLSGLNLSGIPADQWKHISVRDCKLRNTILKVPFYKPYMDIFIYSALEESFKNSGINFSKALRHNNHYIESFVMNCDFSNAKIEVANYLDLLGSCFVNCDFSGTDFSIPCEDFLDPNKHKVFARRFNELKKVYKDNGMTRSNLEGVFFLNCKIDKDFFEQYKDYPEIIYFDLGTIKKSNLKIDSFGLYSLIQRSLENKFEEIVLNRKSFLSKLNEDETLCKEILKYIEEALELATDNELVELYELLSKDFSTADKILFFLGHVENKNFSNYNMPKAAGKFFKKILFYSCSFDNVTFNNSCSEIGRTDFVLNSTNGGWTNYLSCTAKNITFIPDITKSSWKEVLPEKKLFGSITFKTNLYLELQRSCNMHCTFCRNEQLENKEYNLGNIKSSLISILPYIDSVVIGGGEPTLLLSDLYELIEFVYLQRKMLYSNDLYNGRYESILEKMETDSFDADHFTKEGIKNIHFLKILWYIFTNGTLDFKNMKKLGTLYNFYISRHSMDEEENADIFRGKSSQFLSNQELMYLFFSGNNVLSATMFKGGLDSLNNIVNYIKKAQNINCRRILLSTLHKGDTFNGYGDNGNIDDMLLVELKNYLILNGYRVSLPICSTAGHIDTIFERKLPNDTSQKIILKEYVESEKLESAWDETPKKSFDLSIDPRGEIYENWYQTKGRVLLP